MLCIDDRGTGGWPVMKGCVRTSSRVSRCQGSFCSIYDDNGRKGELGEND